MNKSVYIFYLCRNKNFTYITYNMRIEEILSEKNINKADLARLLKTTRQNITTLLRSPSASTLERIAAALHVPVWHLFISPEDACKQAQQDDFFAFVRIDGKHMHAETLNEFYTLVDELRITHPDPRKQP